MKNLIKSNSFQLKKKKISLLTNKGNFHYFTFSSLTKVEILENEYNLVIKKLFEVNKFSPKKVNLDNILKICEIMDNPHKNINFIHITGTNGKGSSCKKLATYFENSGYKTGMYISPHITTFRERIQINSNYIEKENIVEILNYIFETNQRNNISLTYFEYVTLLSIIYFKVNKIDIGIMEVGLGGNLDSTNIIMPLLSVITSIGLDHTDTLGYTQQEISEKKAGIIKPNVPCVIGPDCFPKNVFLETAIKNNSHIFIMNNSKSKDYLENYNEQNIKNLIHVQDVDELERRYNIKSEFTNNIMDFDYENRIIARYVIEVFNKIYPNFNKEIQKKNGNDYDFKQGESNLLLDDEIIKKAINSNQPCRKEDVFNIIGREKVYETITNKAQKFFINKEQIEKLLRNLKCQNKSRIKKIYLDVGHNSHGLEKLLFSIRNNNPQTYIRVVTGFSSGKDQKEIIKILCCYSDKIYFASAKAERALPYNELLKIVNELMINYSIDKEIFSHFDDEKIFIEKIIRKNTKLQEINFYDELIHKHQNNLSSFGYNLSKAIIEAENFAEERNFVKDEIIIVCGSFFIMREVRETLGYSDEKDFYEMNELNFNLKFG